ncbi:hypothetical protein ACQP0C_39705 [Nocardia sp. CA-129566]|uniref:hypothetical protein n=1 Tax=Nocardia sp. CA-129566 TaxID=3239976 RepID=UPI003D9696B3
MATGVGLRIAEDNCTAAIVTDGGVPQFIVRESILHMSDDGDTVLGGPAPAGHTHSITGFAAAVGDPAGISVDDGEAYRAEDLVATALFCLINLTAEHLNGAAEFYAAYPAEWPSQYVLSLREALDYLGLRSVLLVSEGDLPGSDAVAPEQSYAYDAARAALAAVLATPAGATPPDPSNAENSTVVTDVIPAVPAPDAQPQAYSAAIPIGEPLVAPVGEPVAPTAVEVPATAAAAEKPKAPHITPLLIGVAAVIGLVLGGLGISVLFHDPATPVPPMRDAKSDQVSVSPSPQPPVNLPTAPVTTTEPPIVITSSEPETTTEAPTATPPPTTTTTEPPTTTTPPTTTRPSRTTTTRPFPMWTAPGWSPQPWEPQYTFDFPSPR